jgi:hypothetical protein
MNVIILDNDQVQYLRELLDGAITARVAVDGGGVKISVDRGMWTSAIGTPQDT